MSNAEAVLGWDLGGAHLKAVLLDGDGAATFAIELPCPLWQGISRLDRAIEEALAKMPSLPVAHAVTMTGELADCFPDRRSGVIALAGALATHLPGGQVHIFAGRLGFLPLSGAAVAAAEIASANWLATAMFLAALVDEALLVDIGSTTSDLVIITDGDARAGGHDDFTRLASDELVYTGVARTPVMSLADRAPFEDRFVGLAAEHFATTADVYRLTGELPEAADLHPSADGGPKTIEGSARRLARMVGRDAISAPVDSWKHLAGFFADRQLDRLVDAATRVLARSALSPDTPVVGAGAGAFLARKLAARLGHRYVDLASLMPLAGASPDAVMTCAPAFAVARLLPVSPRDASR